MASWNTLFGRASGFSLASSIAALCVAAAASAAPAAQDAAAAVVGPVRIQHTADWYKQQHAVVPLARTQTSQGSGNLTYHNGPVMLSNNTYAIYWAPSGHAISSSYQTLINRYFRDVGGTSFFNIATQYYQNPGPAFPANASIFVGSYVDTTAYPHAGTPSAPLTDADIQNAVRRAIAARGWPVGQNNLYFVFTAQGIESCADANNCTPGTAHPAFCAYHGNETVNGGTVAYANMPYGETWSTSCRSFTKSPNGNIAADNEISTVSHEHFEAVTDVLATTGPNAWYDAAGFEIGDKCGYQYGTISSTGSNVTLHGDPYIVQQEYSNAARNCVLSR
jgi:hypothetical protein